MSCANIYARERACFAALWLELLPCLRWRFWDRTLNDNFTTGVFKHYLLYTISHFGSIQLLRVMFGGFRNFRRVWSYYNISLLQPNFKPTINFAKPPHLPPAFTAGIISFLFIRSPLCSSLNVSLIACLHCSRTPGNPAPPLVLSLLDSS